MDSPEKKQDGEITQIGKYEIVDVLGRGGMGVVYRAIDKQIGREVAIKTLTQGFTGDPGMLARFYEEGRRTGRLKHPNIVTVYDLGDDNGTPYIVMECVEGQPLDKLLRSGAQLSMAGRLGILEEVCLGLGYAHRNNVIHRDVKPANIFVQPDGTAKLIDFGIARLEKRKADMNLTQTGFLLGTVPYMAPERLRNEEVDGRSDIFAAGVVLFELVAGERPFTGTDTVLMSKILTEPHPRLSTIRPGLPASLELIIDQALAKSPDDRYSTAEEMAADLTAVIAELGQEQLMELLTEARRLKGSNELQRARAVLHQLLKIDAKHAEARAMLSEIQRYFAQRQREERIQQICQQAEDALSHNRYDQSLAVLESGLELDTQNPALVKLREKVRGEKEKQDRVADFIQQAETARRKGDFKSALEAAKKALTVDQSNPRIAALNNTLTKEAEEAERQSQAKALLDSARGEIGSRRYSEAVVLLKQVEAADPTNPELRLLLEDANAGLEQLRRKEAVVKLEEEFAQATSYEQLQQVARSIQEAMAAMPAESALFRLNAMAERQIKEYENRQSVDETIQACRNLRPREALELVRKARLRLPGEERLISLEALFAERIGQQEVDERRAETLSKAREALAARRYSDAARILEACQTDGIATGEILSLLDFARTEELERKRQDQLHDQIAKAQQLISEEAWDEAVKFLEDALQQADDAALRLLLDQASSGRDSLRRQIEAALASAVSQIQAGKQDEAVEFLKKQHEAVRRSVRMQTALAAIEEECAQALFRTLGRAYSGLKSDLPAGDAAMRRTLAASANSPVFVPIAEAFRARGRTVADRLIAEATGNAKLLLGERNRQGAEDALKAVSGLADFASTEVRSEWQETQRTAGQTGRFARPRG